MNLFGFIFELVKWSSNFKILRFICNIRICINILVKMINLYNRNASDSKFTMINFNSYEYLITELTLF